MFHLYACVVLRCSCLCVTACVCVSVNVWWVDVYICVCEAVLRVWCVMECVLVCQVVHIYVC